MARNHILNTFIYLMIAVMANTVLPAAEHHGIVKFAGLGVPGATVTATQGDKKLVAITEAASMLIGPCEARPITRNDMAMR